MDRNDVISTLNDLIETSKDGEQGFRTCADAVTSPRLKQLLETAAERCTQGALELQNKVRSLGGDPERSGSASGALHRGWVNIKSVITGTNEAAARTSPSRSTVTRSKRTCRWTCARWSSGNTKVCWRTTIG